MTNLKHWISLMYCHITFCLESWAVKKTHYFCHRKLVFIRKANDKVYRSCSLFSDSVGLTHTTAAMGKSCHNLKRDLQNLCWSLSSLVTFSLSLSYLQIPGIFKAHCIRAEQTMFSSKYTPQSLNVFFLVSLACFENWLSAFGGKEWARKPVLNRRTAGGGQITIRRTFVQ